MSKAVPRSGANLETKLRRSPLLFRQNVSCCVPSRAPHLSFWNAIRRFVRREILRNAVDRGWFARVYGPQVSGGLTFPISGASAYTVVLFFFGGMPWRWSGR